MANLEMHVGDSKLLTVVPKEGDVVVPPEDVTGDQFSYIADPGSLMPVVYVSQLLCAPTMAIFLGTSGGMALGWKVYLACTAVGMVLLLASLFASPMKKTK